MKLWKYALLIAINAWEVIDEWLYSEKNLLWKKNTTNDLILNMLKCEYIHLQDYVVDI